MLYRLLLVVCLAGVSCATPRLVQTELYFGQSTPSGGKLTEAEWDQFNKIYINRVFKEGSTLINVTGNWYDPDKRQLITEPAYKVIYLYRKSKQLSLQIDSLRYWYKTLFQQQSVLRVDKRVRAWF